jgi:diamine N-acetyltransferase
MDDPVSGQEFGDLRARRHVCGLSVAPEQELYVAPNWRSLLLAAYGFTGELAHLAVVPLAVCVAEQVVGFVMYNTGPERDRFFIMRLMVDRTVQGRGYGRATMEQLIARFKEYPLPTRHCSMRSWRWT